MIHEYGEKKAHFDGMFREMCAGDEDAFHVCWAVFQFLHVVDDLVDRDHPVTPEVVGLSLVVFIEAVAANLFFQKHRGPLLACLRTSVMEWVDSEKWRARADLREKLAAEILKSQYQNFFFLISGICGGLLHQHAMSTKFRQYQWD